jgi:hypothetical protein
LANAVDKGAAIRLGMPGTSEENECRSPFVKHRLKASKGLTGLSVEGLQRRKVYSFLNATMGSTREARRAGK